MKMKDADYDRLRKRIESWLKAKGVLLDELKERYKTAGYSMKRMRWDLVYGSDQMRFVVDELYKYLDDEHIDTALRKITKTK